MDEKFKISTTVADDIDSESCNIDKGGQKLKEKSELIFEINTICSMDPLVAQPETESLKLTCQDSDNNSFHRESGFPNRRSQSGPNNEENCTMRNTNKEQKRSLKQKSQVADFKNFVDSLKKGDYHRANSVSDEAMAVEEERNEVVDLQENCTIQGENQLSTDSSDCNLLDDSKRSSRRNSKRKKDIDSYCPICGVTVRLNDLESHYNKEVERLSKISRPSKKMHIEEVPRNEAFELVRRNRENRLTARLARFTAKAKSEVKCPVCSLRMSGTAEEINKHVAICIQDEDSDVNVDGDDEEETGSFEEYEIGDQTRIRPISLVPGGYTSLHGDSVRQTAEDEDLNVDIDDTIAYGDSQYSEIDVVIPNTSSEQDRLDLELLRKAVVTDPSARPQCIEYHKWSKTDSDAENQETSKIETDPVVSSLKEKIITLEDQDKSVRCLICLESYTKPVVSTTCWHVHCEECWLMTMGVKKLCPQCNMIVFPSDLRKIYL